jgi:predicted phage terminase large subunit-like protein
MSYISGLEEHEVEALRDYLSGDFEAFSKFCFKVMTGTPLIHVDYYVILFKAIQRLIDLESNRMIMNIPPRAGKTLIISIFLPLFAWVRNPSGQSILTGFNSDVLAECSGYIRTIMSDPDFRRVFPDVVIDNNKKSVERLGTMSAGVIHAIPTSGKMTGKGCGALVEGFAGLMSIDDVIKPDDAQSPTERDKINNRFSNTLLSRLATETTPLIIIMQRLHADDLCGYLMKGGSSDTYDWVNIPGIITEDTGSKEWYDKQIEEFGYTHVDPILYELPEGADRVYTEHKFGGETQKISSFWSIRKTVETLLGLCEKDPYTFYSQYMGTPVGKGKRAVKMEYIRTYKDIEDVRIKYTFMTADTASTTKTYSDYSVACLWGVTYDKHLVLMDVIINKWEVPELIVAMREFWQLHNVFNRNKPTWKPRGFYIEDKSSGLFLNQQFLRDGTVNVKPVPRDGTAANDKFSRFINTIPYFEQGKILLPSEHKHYPYILRELLGQSELGSATGHDDFADNVADAVAIAFAQAQMSYESWS